jgi:Tol biopolymer transport system component
MSKRGKYYSCCRCGISFATVGEFLDHRKQFHSSVPDPTPQPESLNSTPMRHQSDYKLVASTLGSVTHDTAQIYSIDLATKKTKAIITGGINTYSSWSPDMRQIAFRKIIGQENSEVFVANSDGSNLRNLTNNPFFDGWPAWSPDGKQIAFASNRRAHGYQVFVMNPDGSNVKLVANTEGRATAPRWSPDGKTIYFTNCVEKDYGADCEILTAQLNRQ